MYYTGIENVNELLGEYGFEFIESDKLEHYEIIPKDYFDGIIADIIPVAIWSDEADGKSAARFVLAGYINVWTSKKDIRQFGKKLREYGELLNKLNTVQVCATDLDIS